MVAAGLDTSQRRAIRADPIHPCFEKCFPIVLGDLVESVGQTLKCVWLHLGWTVRGPEKNATKVIERLFTVRLFANRGVHFEPDEDALLVEIHSTPHRFPIAP